MDIIGTKENLLDLFDELKGMGAQVGSSESASSEYRERPTHITIFPNSRIIGLYRHSIRGKKGKLNANLPSHRKHILRIVRKWNNKTEKE